MKITEIIDYTNPTRVVQNGNVFHFDDEGQLHRDNDEPAIEYKDGKKEYWKHGKRYNPDGADEKVKPIVKITHMPKGGKDIMLTYPDGTVEKAREFLDGRVEFYDDNGYKHRDGDSPAVIKPDGSRLWFRHGRMHRDDNKPAVINADGSKYWYLNNLAHRDGGPAVIRADGTQEWWFRGAQVK